MSRTAPRGRRALRVAAWVAGGGLVVLALLLGLAATWVSTSAGREHVRALLEREVQARVPGFRLGGVSLGLPDEITLRDVRVTDPQGQLDMAIPEVRARIDLFSLLRRRLDLEQLTIVAPRLSLQARPHAPLLPAELVRPSAEPSAWSRWSLAIDHLDLDNGKVAYQQNGRLVLVRVGSLQGALDLSRGRVAATVSTSALAEAEERRIAVELTARATHAGDVFDLQLERLDVRGATPDGVVAANGSVHGTLGALAVDVAVRLPAGGGLRLAGLVHAAATPTYELHVDASGVDPRALAAEWPEGALSLAATVDGAGLPFTAGSTARIEARLLPSALAGRREITAELSADTAGSDWRVPGLMVAAPGAVAHATGSGTLRRFAVSASATVDAAAAPREWQARGTARLALEAHGDLPLRLDAAHLVVTGSGIAVRGTSARSLRAELNVDGDLEGLRGTATARVARLQLEPGGPVVDRLSIDANRRGDAFRVALAAAGQGAGGTLAAHGTATSSTAHVVLQRLRLRYRDVRLDLRQSAELRWSKGELVTLRGLRAAILGGEVDADGTYRMAGPGAPAAQVQLAARRLHLPELPLPLSGRARVHLARGSLDGEASLAAGAGTVLSLSASVPVREGGGGLPRIAPSRPVNARLVLRDFPLAALPAQLREPLGVKSGVLNGSARVSGDMAAPHLLASLSARQLALRGLAALGVNANVEVTTSGIAARVSATLDDAPLFDAKGEIAIGSAALVAGRSQSGAPLSARLTIPRGEVARLSAAFPELQGWRGTLSGDLLLAGTIERPTARGDLLLTDAVVDEVPFTRVSLSGVYDAPSLRAEVAAQEKAGGVLRASVEEDGAGHLRGRVQAQALEIAPLQALVPKLTMAQGRVDADLAIAGSAATPAVTGTLALHAGSFGITGMPELTAVEVRAHLEQETIHLDSIHASSRGGRIDASGWLRLRGVTPEALELRVTSKDLALSPEVLPGASLSAQAVASGATHDGQLDIDVRVRDGLLKIPRIESGRKLQRLGPLRGVEFVDAERAAAPSASRRRLLPEKVKLTVSTSDFQVRGGGLQADFTGRLSLETENGAMVASGEVEAQHGTVLLFGNRYDLRRARISWNGQPNVNPMLDLRLTHQFPDAVVAIVIRGTAESPRLAFESDPAAYSRDQMISLVLTGHTTEAPGSGANLAENAVGAISTALLGDLAQRIAPALPLDILRIERVSTSELGQHTQPTLPGSPGATATLVEVGKYLTPRIRVSYVHVFGATAEENSNETVVEYQVARNLFLRAEFGDAGVGGVDMLWARPY